MAPRLDCLDTEVDAGTHLISGLWDIFRNRPERESLLICVLVGGDEGLLNEFALFLLPLSQSTSTSRRRKYLPFLRHWHANYECAQRVFNNVQSSRLILCSTRTSPSRGTPTTHNSTTDSHPHHANAATYNLSLSIFALLCSLSKGGDHPQMHGFACLTFNLTWTVYLSPVG